MVLILEHIAKHWMLLVCKLMHLGLRRVTDSPAVMPSEIQLQEIWPRRKTIPFKSLFWLPAKLKPDEID